MNTILTTDFPEAAGLSASCIANTLREIDQKGICMHSFLMWKDEKLCAEGYYAPVKRDDLHRMFSVTKSFVSIAIGLLQEEGRLLLDDSIVTFFPEYVPDPSRVHPWLAATTIRDMLSMRSCHASTTYDKFSSKTDWVKSFFTVLPTHKPGTVFHYDTSSTHTLCALVEKLSGMTMLDYLRRKVLDEIGFSKEAYCLKDGFGVSMGGSGLMATSRDLMLFALLILKQGQLNGKQYIPAEYLKEATSFQTATCVTGPVPSESMGYGLQFWIGEHDAIVCYGMGGQLAILLPKYNTAIVTTADTQGYQGGNQVIYDAIWRHILPELEKRLAPWTPNDAEKCEFEQFMRGLAMQPLKQQEEFTLEVWNNKIENVNDINPSFLTSFRSNMSSSQENENVNDINRTFFANFQRIMSSFVGTYIVNKNFAERQPDTHKSAAAAVTSTIWDQVSFEIEQPSKKKPLGTGKLTLKSHISLSPMASDETFSDETVSIEFGIGMLKEGTLTMTTHMGNRADEPAEVSMRYAASAAWLDENTLYIRIHLLDTCIGSIHIQAVFGDSDVTIFFRKQEETLFGEFSGHFYGTRVNPR